MGQGIATIFWRDFRTDFFSIKTAAITFFFLILMGAFFFNQVDTYLAMQAQAPAQGLEAPPLHQVVSALFGVLHFILILVIPGLTMGSFAEERRLQTIRLLQAAPISATAVVVGKFLAALALMSCVLAASLVFPLFLLAHGSPDLGILASSYLGLFLLICSELAFGLWVSSLTRAPFLAFLFTSFGLFLLLVINSLAAFLKGSSPAHAFLRYIGATEHLATFLQGVISVSDTVYFVGFTVVFLFLAQGTYDALRWR